MKMKILFFYQFTSSRFANVTTSRNPSCICLIEIILQFTFYTYIEDNFELKKNTPQVTKKSNNNSKEMYKQYIIFLPILKFETLHESKILYFVIQE